MGWFKIRTEEEVEEIFNELLQRSKGDYVTRSVSFSKNSAEQMELLKKSIAVTAPFSILVRGLLENFDVNNSTDTHATATLPSNPTTSTIDAPPSAFKPTPSRSTGNFT